MNKRDIAFSAQSFRRTYTRNLLPFKINSRNPQRHTDRARSSYCPDIFNAGTTFFFLKKKTEGLPGDLAVHVSHAILTAPAGLKRFQRGVEKVHLARWRKKLV